jgi:4-hydroxy-4-methyl-2-oxoglutarate aldolase
MDGVGLSDSDNRPSSASLHEAAGRTGALPCSIKGLAAHMRVYAPAFPVRCAPGSNLALHHAIYAAREGDVLVVDVGDGIEFGYWGEVMTAAALQRGLAGLVITGGVRDVEQICASGFPVYCGAISLRGTDKNPKGSSLSRAISIGGVSIQRGDLISADADGVVVIPQDQAKAVVDLAISREQAEIGYLARLRAGETTLSIYELPALTADSGSEPGSGPRSAQRRSIEVVGLGHSHLPIPAASRIGPLVATGGVNGIDRATGQLPESAAEQVRLMFANLKSILEAAGGTMNDILKVTVWATNRDLREEINRMWVSLFPDPNNRPSRHILTYELPGPMHVQCEALGFISESQASQYDHE